MRLNLRLANRRLGVLLGLVAALVVPAAGQAATHGPKLDGSLAAAVEAATASDATAPLHVLVYGTNLPAANSANRVSPRNDLDLLGAESLTIPADEVDALAGHDGVTFMTLDAPVIPTGAPAPAGASFSALSRSAFSCAPSSFVSPTQIVGRPCPFDALNAS